MAVCQKCGGSGFVESDDPLDPLGLTPCDVCGGDGEVPDVGEWGDPDRELWREEDGGDWDDMDRPRSGRGDWNL